ncbi:unnamed protein product [Rotaria sp. Silwood1]|nr:unnamed protein product [Rotaria sp. Silwood1]
MHSSGRRRHAAVILFDIKAAFDSVWHDGLIYKLNELRLPQYLTNYLISFLQNRTAAIEIENILSRPFNLNSGTPQGSPLSPLLYIIYTADSMNGIPEHTEHGLFADDTALWTSSNTITSLSSRLQQSIDEFQSWCNSWKLKLQPSKTELVHFTVHPRKQFKNPISVKIDDTIVKASNSTRYLVSQKTCYLFGDRLSDGELIADQTAETVYITARNPSDYGSVKIFSGFGNGTFVVQYNYYDSYRKRFVVVDDFNGDNYLDFAVALTDDNSVTLHLANKTGSFIVRQGFRVGANPFAMVSGKFNGDNYADLAVANFDSDTVSILLGTVNGTFENATNYAVGDAPASIAAGYFNGDSYIDLIVANFNNHTMSVLLGKGNGSFATANTFLAGVPQPRSIAVADMNIDGIPDVVVGYVNYGSSKVGVLIGKCDGTFYLPTRFFSTAYAPNAIGIADFNGDTRLDIVVLNSDSNVINIFLNVGP